MGKKISNEARMLGILPSEGADPIPVGRIPDGGTQIVGYKVAEANTLILRTVGDDDTLYLSTINLCCYNVNASARTVTLFVRDIADDEWFNIFSFFLLQNVQEKASLSLFPPLEIPAGYDVCVKSSGADCIAFGWIHGYEA